MGIQQLIMSAFSGGGGGGFKILNSLRLRRSATGRLERSVGMGGPTLATKFTFNTWVKLGLFQANESIFSTQNGANSFIVSGFWGGDTNPSFRIVDYRGSNVIDVRTTPFTRDPTAWYNLHIVCDGALAAGQRVKVYLNGNLLPVSTNIDTTDFTVGGAYLHALSTVGSSAADIYLAEANVIVGQALPPTSFGEFNTVGVWVPKKFAGSYGTVAAHLDFADKALTSGSNVGLGKDVSGNGNYWNTTGISVTAGVTYDAMVDTPTNNFCTLNPLQAYPGNLSAANLNIALGGVSSSALATIGVSSGKWYWEVNGESVAYLGIAQGSFAHRVATYIGGTLDSWGYTAGGTKYNNAIPTAYGATFTTGDFIGFALDMDAGTVTAYKNGATQGVMVSGLTGPWFPAIAANDVKTLYLNFGQGALFTGATYYADAGGYFKYAPPTGFKSLCTSNLPVVAIQKPADHFNIALAAGASIKAAAEALFSGNVFEWIKDRANANNHQLLDVVRSLTAVLQSNTTAAETTYVAPAGNSVGWVWKAGGAAVANNAGSIASQVSANTTSGFSVVTYTGNNLGGQTVGHGLGKALAMLIIKNRQAGANAWVNWNKGLAATELLTFTTAAKATDANSWDGGVSSSTTTFKVGNASASYDTNLTTGGGQHVAYCFAEIAGFSKFGSYTGNGNADGPCVNCGFRPRYVMIKRTDSTGDWTIFDAARNTYNGMDLELYPSNAIAESAAGGVGLDYVASGFKLRRTGPAINASGGTYIYAAFAEFPFGGENVSPSPAR